MCAKKKKTFFFLCRVNKFTDCNYAICPLFRPAQFDVNFFLISIQRMNFLPTKMDSNISFCVSVSVCKMRFFSMLFNGIASA